MASKNKRLSHAMEIFEKDIEGSIIKINLSEIEPTQTQPRKEANFHIEELAKSLEEEGLLQPIVVSKTGDTYKIIAGERRFRAASLNNWTSIECKVLNKNEKDSFRIAVIENLQRENLNAYDEASAYLRLKREYSYTDQDLSKIIGKSRSYISEILSIAEIPQAYVEKAQQASISTKNMLVQLSQAWKSGYAEEFIQEFQNKSITTIKKAKEFNKIKKNKTTNEKTKPSKQIELNNAKINTNQLIFNSTWQNDNQIKIEILINNASNMETPLEKLENKISKALTET